MKTKRSKYFKQLWLRIPCFFIAFVLFSGAYLYFIPSALHWVSPAELIETELWKDLDLPEDVKIHYFVWYNPFNDLVMEFLISTHESKANEVDLPYAQSYSFRQRIYFHEKQYLTGSEERLIHSVGKNIDQIFYALYRGGLFGIGLLCFFPYRRKTEHETG